MSEIVITIEDDIEEFGKSIDALKAHLAKLSGIISDEVITLQQDLIQARKDWRDCVVLRDAYEEGVTEELPI